MAPKPGPERQISSRVPLQPGYVFVKKGDPYVTRHCRQLTKSTGKTLFVVVDDKKRPLGLRVPASIHATVTAADAATKPSRLAATAAKDAREHAEARATLRRLFPALPKAVRTDEPGNAGAIVDHAFRKHSGRVGRAGAMGMEEKVLLGVRAHVRHRCTAYERLMREGLSRDEARRRVAEEVEAVVRRWQGPSAEEPEGRSPGGRRGSLRVAAAAAAAAAPRGGIGSGAGRGGRSGGGGRGGRMGKVGVRRTVVTQRRGGAALSAKSKGRVTRKTVKRGGKQIKNAPGKGRRTGFKVQSRREKKH